MVAIRKSFMVGDEFSSSKGTNSHPGLTWPFTMMPMTFVGKICFQAMAIDTSNCPEQLAPLPREII